MFLLHVSPRSDVTRNIERSESGIRIGQELMPDDSDSVSAVHPKRTGRLSNVLKLIISALVRKGKFYVKKVTIN